MNRLLMLLVLFIMATAAFAVTQTPGGEINVDDGIIIANGNLLYINRQYDGKRIELTNVRLTSAKGDNPGFFLSMYWDKVSEKQPLRTLHFIIVDAAGKEVRLSNVLDTGLKFQWEDNNYVLFDRNTMYFGIYSPRRMQFVYRDGRLAEDKGPWRGPAKPEQYIVPEDPGPCFNVGNVPDCIEELEREQERAARRARQKHRAKHKAKPPVSAPQPAVSH